jgi:hypothetical protein
MYRRESDEHHTHGSLRVAVCRVVHQRYYVGYKNAASYAIRRGLVDVRPGVVVRDRRNGRILRGDAIVTMRSPFSTGTITVDYDVLRDVLDWLLVTSSTMVERERQAAIERAIVQLRWKQADADVQR